MAEINRCTAAQVETHLYGRFGRFARGLLRLFSKRYQCGSLPETGPCVYVCRHLNMHGPYTTLKWMPLEMHPFILSVFMEKETAVAHFARYTFSEKKGKAQKPFLLRAELLGRMVPKLMQSLKAIPVYRDSASIKTMRIALKHLQEGRPLIIWPDVHYTEGYDRPCEIYHGFLYLGELYYRRTGQELSFIPLWVDDANRRIVVRDAITLKDYQAEKVDAAMRLQKALNPAQ